MAKNAATKTPKPARAAKEFDDSVGVTALIVALTHPMTPAIQAIRETIMGADPAITEGVKWKSPSFYCHGWFATLGLRKPDRVEIVLHHGAKVRQDAALQGTITDAGNLLVWVSFDRAIITVSVHSDFETMRANLGSIIEQWAVYQKILAEETLDGET